MLQTAVPDRFDLLPGSCLLPAGCGPLLLRTAVVLRTVHLAHTSSAEVLGPGDVLHPDGPSDDTPASTVSVTTLRAGVAELVGADRLSTLDADALTALHLHLAEQQKRAALHRAIVALPRVEDRVLHLVGTLAGRWGRVTPAGVLLALPMTHEQLGNLVGARRPTVSLALKLLRQMGLLDRDASGSWILDRAALEGLAAVAA